MSENSDCLESCAITQNKWITLALSHPSIYEIYIYLITSNTKNHFIQKGFIIVAARFNRDYHLGCGGRRVAACERSLYYQMYSK